MPTANLPLHIAVDPDPLVQIVRKHVSASAAQLESIRADFLAMLAVQIVPTVTPGVRRAPLSHHTNADSVLTTEQAAQLVGVSRPYFVKLIDAGQIPLHQKVGNQRRVLRSAVLDWQTGQQASQQAAMTAFAHGLEDELGL